jgi:hypothetical protein
MRVYLKDGNFFGITDQMEGKMEGMRSLNTSAECNPFCQKMRGTAGTICASCYSKATERRWKNARAAFENNYRVLSTHSLKGENIPVINASIFRFQAHGELINRIHYKNLIHIVDANPATTFALWTKRLPIIKQGGIILRDNLVYIYSTPKLDELSPRLPDGFDKVFTVYRRATVKANAIQINCGAKSCNTCRLCYAKNDTHIVNELIKSNSHKD